MMMEDSWCSIDVPSLLQFGNRGSHPDSACSWASSWVWGQQPAAGLHGNREAFPGPCMEIANVGIWVAGRCSESRLDNNLCYETCNWMIFSDKNVQTPMMLICLGQWRCLRSLGASSRGSWGPGMLVVEVFEVDAYLQGQQNHPHRQCHILTCGLDVCFLTSVISFSQCISQQSIQTHDFTSLSLCMQTYLLYFL